MRNRVSIACLFLLLCVGLISAQNSKEKLKSRQAKHDFSGTWVFDEALTRRARPKQFMESGEEIRVVISDDQPEIKISKKTSEDGHEQTQDFVYYDDGRGETNPNPTLSLNLKDVSQKVQSVTKWKNDKLVITSRVQIARREGFYHVEVRDKWELSADGQTVIQTTTVNSDSVNIAHLASIPVVIIWGDGEIKRVYRRMSN